MVKIGLGISILHKSWVVFCNCPGACPDLHAQRPASRPCHLRPVCYTSIHRTTHRRAEGCCSMPAGRRWLARWRAGGCTGYQTPRMRADRGTGRAATGYRRELNLAHLARTRGVRTLQECCGRRSMSWSKRRSKSPASYPAAVELSSAGRCVRRAQQSGLLQSYILKFLHSDRRTARSETMTKAGRLVLKRRGRCELLVAVVR